MRQRPVVRSTRIEQVLVTLVVVAVIVGVTWLLSQEIAGEFPRGCANSHSC